MYFISEAVILNVNRFPIITQRYGFLKNLLLSLITESYSSEPCFYNQE
jgi:hypothetical protein